MKEITFEMQLEQLKEIVNRIDQGNLSLEEMVKLYEEGIGAYKACQEKINNTKIKVEILNRSLVGDAD